MQVVYTVHSATLSPATVQATFNGSPISAIVEEAIVELVSQDGTMSHTLRAMPGADATALMATFTPGASITATFEPTPAG